MRAVVESGECFVRLLPAEITPANPIGLRLQVLESDHLDTSRQGVIEGVPTLQGIGLGEAGEPVGYWLHRVHPGASWVLPGGATWLSSQRVPARDVLHIYRKRRPGQLRDVSWLAPVLARLRDLGDYEAALLMKAKIEACLAAVVSEDGDDAMTGPASGLLRDAQGRTVESFEPGMILYRRGIGSVEVVNPSGGGSHAAFARRALEASAVGTGLTYDQVAGDLTQANYSSLRAGKIEFRRLCEQVQYGMLIPMLVRPISVPSSLLIKSTWSFERSAAQRTESQRMRCDLPEPGGPFRNAARRPSVAESRRYSPSSSTNCRLPNTSTVKPPIPRPNNRNLGEELSP